MSLKADKCCNRELISDESLEERDESVVEFVSSWSESSSLESAAVILSVRPGMS